MRKPTPSTLAFVLAGGEGTRLFPLTTERCKPSVPFNGKYRLVDFVLSNLANSGIPLAYLLVQHKAQGLIQHVSSGNPVPVADSGAVMQVTALGPTLRNGRQHFTGTADAVAQNLHLIETHKPDLVAVFSADHIYRMDVRQMIDAHMAANAEITVATLPVPVSQCASFGIVETDDELRIRAFQEKPAHTRSMPGRPGLALASMGNYLFSADVLQQELQRADCAIESDFGSHILPRLVRSRRMLAYDFTHNLIPGMADFEDNGYWRDVGTIDAYFEAHLDTLGGRPKFRMANPAWPIHSRMDTSGPVWIEGSYVTDSVVGADCVVDSAQVRHSMLRRSVRVGRDADLSQAIVMDRSVVGRGARIVRAIIDQDNCIPDGESIGVDLERDRKRFHVSKSGVVVVPRGHFSRTRNASPP